MFFSLQATLNCCKLIIISNSLLLQAFNDLLIGFLDRLRLIVFDHNLIKTVFQDSNVLHQWAFLDIASFAVLNLSEHVLEMYKSFLLSS